MLLALATSYHDSGITRTGIVPTLRYSLYFTHYTEQIYTHSAEPLENAIVRMLGTNLKSSTRLKPVP